MLVQYVHIRNARKNNAYTHVHITHLKGDIIINAELTRDVEFMLITAACTNASLLFILSRERERTANRTNGPASWRTHFYHTQTQRDISFNGRWTPTVRLAHNSSAREMRMCEM